MKKKAAVSLLLALMLTLTCAAALAATANASIIAPHTVKVTAPYAGTLLPFDLEAGDSVTAGDVLFTMDAAPIYAPQDGKVAAVFAEVGDDAAGIAAHYGAVAVIEPVNPLFVDASTRDAYNDPENRYIHTGETVYLKCGSEKGTGRVTSVSGSSYAVEILTGEYDIGDTIRIFREDGFDSDSELGRGKATRYADAVVSAQGRIAAVHVKPGDSVKTGDLLFEVVDTSAPAGASRDIASSVDGAVTMLYATPGAQVYRGMLLCEIADLTRLELSAEIDEIDVGALRVGDTLSYTLDAYPDKTFSGTITEIRPIGTAKQNAAYFDVRISVPEGSSFLPGMNATVTLGE